MDGAPMDGALMVLCTFSIDPRYQVLVPISNVWNAMAEMLKSLQYVMGALYVFLQKV